MPNDDLFEQVRAKAHMLNPAVWVMDNEFVNENQQRFEFDAHRFMLQPYADSTPEQVIRKSAQVGWSVAAILKSVHAAKFIKLNVIYVLPTRNASAEFVVPKVNPMLKRNPTLAAMVMSTDNKSLKQIGDRYIYFKGAFHEGEAISTSADLVVADEFDRSDQGVLSMYQSRLQASKFRWFWRFSNPSLPNFGVDELFMRSDQMHWFVTCSHCGHEWYMDWERDDQERNHYVFIVNALRDLEEGYYACGKCHKMLDDDDRQSGRWVAKYPSRRMRGYWICQMLVPWVSAGHIIRQRNDMTVDVFYNMVLGKAYQASEFLINRTAILGARLVGEPVREQYFLGVDNGKLKHWVLGNYQGVITYGVTDDWEDIERLIKQYDALTVIDALPDFTVPEYLAREYSGQVFVHYYVHDTKNLAVTQKKEGTEFGVLQSDRTKLFDVLAIDITGKKLGFFQTPEALEDLIGHFENMYRVVELDTKQIARARWETKGEGESKRPDHWAHACLRGSMRVDTDRGRVPICDVTTDDRVLTREGYKRVLWSGETKRSATTFTLSLSNGQELVGTGDHPVFVRGKGFIPLHAIAYGDRLLPCPKQKQSFFKGWRTEDILTRRIAATGFITRLAHGIRRGVRNVCTKSYGLPNMGQFPRGILSTTKTIIPSITNYPTWSAYLGAVTSSTIMPLTINTPSLSKVMPLSLMLYGHSHTNGGVQKKAVSGTPNMLKRLSLFRQRILSALSAGVQAKLPANTGRHDFAPGGVRVVGMHENTGSESVYNLSVEGQPEFFANGVLVHNCAYFRVAQSLGLRPENAGAVNAPSVTKERPAFAVHGERANVKEALGLTTQTLLERSLARHRKKKI